MSRARPAVAPLLIPLDPSAPTPLHRQLYAGLRDAILSGRLERGTRLPSSRQLASELHLARSTVVEAFDQLLAEGYLVGRPRSGTYVAPGLPDGRADRVEAQPPTASGGPLPAPSLASEALTDLRTALAPRLRAPVASWAFQVGVPAIDLFPHAFWQRLYAQVWRELPLGCLATPQPAGYGPLRDAIAAYLTSARGVRCRPEQVIVVGGSQQGLALIAHVLVNPGDAVWMEDPGYLGARQAFTAARAQLVPVPLDAEGLDLAAGQAHGPHPRLIYITPSHQFPLGLTMSLARRLALLDWARRTGSWILEDDYDSEFHYAGRPLAALQGLDEGGQVIYIGTFSKTLLPNLRLGFLVVPEALRDVFTAAAEALGTQAPLPEQATVAQFLAVGHFARHLRRMRVHYAQRQAALVEAVHTLLPGVLTVQPAPTGMHLLGWLPSGVSDVAAAQTAAQARVATLPLSLFRMAATEPGALLMGYAAADPTAIRVAVQRLAGALIPLCQK